MYRCNIILLYVSVYVYHVQVNYTTALCVYALHTGALQYCCMYLCGMYSCTIILLYVSVHYVHVNYNTAVCVFAVCTGAL